MARAQRKPKQKTATSPPRSGGTSSGGSSSGGTSSGGTSSGSSGRLPGVRIIGGKFRGRRLRYGGDSRVRPMKDRVREAIFNLIGPAIEGKAAIDLFGGTGALGLESLSRGAVRATLIEQHFPTAAIIRENVATLGVEAITQVVTSSVFIWHKRGVTPGDLPWVVFCSPPYDFYVDRTDAMLELIGGLMETAPEGSIFAVESDDRFDFDLLPNAGAWDVRTYSPAVVGVHTKKST